LKGIIGQIRYAALVWPVWLDELEEELLELELLLLLEFIQSKVIKGGDGTYSIYIKIGFHYLWWVKYQLINMIVKWCKFDQIQSIKYIINQINQQLIK
jgi:hypothetical protein